MAYYDKDKIKTSLSTEQIMEFLEHFSAEPQPITGGCIAKTVCHNGAGEGSDKLYYYDNTKLFNCYTGCGAMDIFELLIKIVEADENRTLTFYEAMDYVAKFFQLEGVEGEPLPSFKEKADLEIIEDYKILLDKDNQISVEYKIYSDNLIKNLEFVPPAPWIREGITTDTMRRYNIRYYPIDHKIVIPHYNVAGDLIGIRGRTMNPDDAKRFGKYMPLSVGGKMYSHPLSQNLYGLDLNLGNINTARKIIIFEGEKSVMHYDSMFGENNNIAVATCGNSLSLIQEELIKKYCEVDEVIIAYDKEFAKIGDSDFQRNVQDLMRIAKRLKPYYKVSFMFDKNKEYPLLDLKDAPIDKGKEVFIELYKNRIFI